MVRTGKKQEIVNAAVSLLAAGGAEGLTASALASRAGVSKANLFHHFESLDDIVLAAFEDFILGMESLSAPPAGTFRGWLEALMAEATQSVSAAPELSGAYLGFVARARSDARLRARLEDLVTGIDAAFAQIVRSFRPDMGDAEVRALATLVLIAGDGLLIHRDLFPGRAQVQAAAWRAFIDLVAGKED
jgi:AcrR family transcriptional regulator